MRAPSESNQFLNGGTDVVTPSAKELGKSTTAWFSQASGRNRYTGRGFRSA